MSEKKIVVPKAMLEAAEHFDSCDQTEKVLQAALKWLADNPIVPTEEQAIGILHKIGHAALGSGWMKQGVVEWQRQMFLAPEPTIPEEIKDLLYPSTQIEQYPTIEIRKEAHNQQIIEAFQRGYRSAK